MHRTAVRVAVTAGVLVLLGAWSSPRAPIRIEPNDNTRAAGRLRNGVLTVSLETSVGSWRPDGDGGRAIDSMVAFAETGHAPSTPGPLIRVPLGTLVSGTIRNTLRRPLTVYGLGRTRALTDSLVVPARSIAPFEFAADHPGTFLYLGRTLVDTLTGRDAHEMQLQGTIVVDAAGAPADRVFAISWYFTIDPRSANGLGSATMAINGLSWPHTERLVLAQGDSVHWRVVNFTDADHPMHLHGFYFRVDGRTARGVDTAYAAEQQRMAVTEVLAPYTAMRLAWKAERPGNWVFHCHYALHISNYVTLDTRNGALDPAAEAHHHSDRPHQMYGLVTGITITPKGPQVAAAEPARRIRIEQRKKEKTYGEQAGMSFVVSEDGKAPDPEAMPVPGPALVLERGTRVQVIIVNQSDEHAAVHWHGIELESYPDGVPGWSGSGADVLPAIAPHESLTVAWTPPRAGSFMYHSHFNESRQMGGGLYGPIIVLEPGERYDAETDRVLFFGTAGSQLSLLTQPPAVLLNGSAQPAPMELKAGTRYRFRLFDLAGDDPTVVSLTQDGTPVQWRAVAKDGYPLPAAQATVGPATLRFEPGEIYDFEFTPARAGELTLSFGPPQPPAPSNVPPPVAVAVHVR